MHPCRFSLLLGQKEGVEQSLRPPSRRPAAGVLVIVGCCSGRGTKCTTAYCSLCGAAAVTQEKYPLSGQLRIRGEGAVALIVDLSALLMQGRVRPDYLPFLICRILFLFSVVVFVPASGCLDVCISFFFPFSPFSGGKKLPRLESRDPVGRTNFRLSLGRGPTYFFFLWRDFYS